MTLKANIILFLSKDFFEEDITAITAILHTAITIREMRAITADTASTTE